MNDTWIEKEIITVEEEITPVEINENNGRRDTLYGGHFNFKCPNCSDDYIIRRSKYCTNCGAKIKWISDKLGKTNIGIEIDINDGEEFHGEVSGIKYQCPNCGENEILDYFEYCPSCGLGIKWTL